MIERAGGVGREGGIGGIAMQGGWEHGMHGLQGMESVTGKVFTVEGRGMVQIPPLGTPVLPDGVPSGIVYQPVSMPLQVPQQTMLAPNYPSIVNQQTPQSGTQPPNLNAVPATTPSMITEALPTTHPATLAPPPPVPQRELVPTPVCQLAQTHIPPSEPISSVSDVNPIATVAKPADLTEPKDAVPVFSTEASNSAVQATDPAPVAKGLED